MIDDVEELEIWNWPPHPLKIKIPKKLKELFWKLPLISFVILVNVALLWSII